MKINRVLICGNRPFTYICASKLLHSLNYVTMLHGGADKNNVVRYVEKNKIYSDRIKVIDRLEDDDIYDVILIDYSNEHINKMLIDLINNRSKIIVFFGLRVDAMNISYEINATGKYKKEVIFANATLKSIFEKNVIKNTIPSNKIVLGHPKGEIKEEVKDVLEEVFDGCDLDIEFEENMDAYLKYSTAVILPIYFTVCKFNGKTEYIDKYSTWMSMAAMDEAMLALQKMCVPEVPSKVKTFVRNHTKILFYLWLRYIRKNKKYKKWINYEINNNKKDIEQLNLSFRKLIGDIIPLKNWKCLEKFLNNYNKNQLK